MATFEKKTASVLLKRLNLCDLLIKHILDDDANGDISFSVIEKITLRRICCSLFNTEIGISDEKLIEELKQISGAV